MKRTPPLTLGLLLLGLTWVVSVYHLSVFPMPEIDREAALKSGGEDRYMPRSEDGLNHIILTGHPYKRGLSVGAFTKHLLDEEEDYLVDEMERFFPNAFLRHTLLFAVRRFYWGIEDWFPEWAVAEMAGVSEFSTDKYNYYADPLTRQIAYHGVHELGQMFVDFDKGDYGCTLMAVPYDAGESRGWVIGRNFDFEAVRILDTEKLIKWVFPDDGFAHVVVSWAGMVGAVTGVNEHGVYLSINAAGSSDFRRFGTPSTLVLVDALQRARDADEARLIIEASDMFITDLFVAADRSGRMFRIEKTPKRVRSIALEGPSAVANHLMHPDFTDDRVNKFRFVEQTTSYRWKRGQDLADAAGRDVQAGLDEVGLEDRMLSMLRDRHDVTGKIAHLGNRRSLDALIATHSVIFNTHAQRLFISRGPALAGGYNGYDLARSFVERRPVAVRQLPADNDVSEEFFYSFKTALSQLTRAKEHLNAGACDYAVDLMMPLETTLGTHAEFLQAMGDASQCQNKDALAKSYWQRALEAGPAYAKHEDYLRERVQ